VQYLNENATNVVLIEDRNKTICIAIGEYYLSDCIPNHFDCSSCRGRRLIQVVLKTCTNPELELPYPIFESGGKIFCRAMEEAFQKRIPIWWKEGTTYIP
jgi:hypothetical protein